MSFDVFQLNLRHLRALCLIAECGRMNAAADNVGLSQPALTQGLAKLERQFGLPMFERVPQGMQPTDAGTIVAKRAEAALLYLARGASSGRSMARPERVMTMRQLHALLAVSDAGSFVAASAASAVSQPALHRAIRDLEQMTDLSLVRRRGRGIAITASGRRLARGARLAANELVAANTEISPKPREVAARLVIGAMPLARSALVPNAVARLASEYPHVSFDIVEGSWRELVELLRDGILDLMIGALRPDPPPDLVQQALLVDNLIIVAGASHPLINVAVPDVGDLSAYPWIVARVGAPLRRQWETLFAGRALPRHPIECGSVMTLRGLLAAGDYLTLLSPDQVAVEIAGGHLVQIGPPLEETRRSIGATTRLGWRPTSIQKRFMELLTEFGSRITIPKDL